ncbi:hypothetical protein SRDD_22070 [Serratia sp. DD3]|nr:hypothetical protein SRDD_22070 [Serratia sp. DD3]
MENFLFFACQNVIFPIICLKQWLKVESYVAVIMLHTFNKGRAVVNNKRQSMLPSRHLSIHWCQERTGENFQINLYMDGIHG